MSESINDALLKVEELRVAYPQQRSPLRESSDLEWSVDRVSFTIAAGERLGLVGESGCGKSTIGRALMQLLPAHTQVKGRVQFAEISILELTPAQLRQFRGEQIALIFQDPMTRLNPLMTIRRHCLETLRIHQPHLSSAQAKTKVLETLAAVKIPKDRLNQYPHEFSGGMRQRVAIALALLLDPKMIVADEPTTSLDVTVAAQILQELTRLCQERQMGLLLISHDLALVSEYCDRVAVMYGGKIVEMGTADDILQNPQHPYTQSLLEAALHLQQSTGGTHPPEGTVLLHLDDLRQHYTLETNFMARLMSGPAAVIKAVDDITLSIHKGETLGLVGESGCGKSTLSRTILQLVRPTAGQVTFDQTNLTQLGNRKLRQCRRQIQMIFQDPRACLNPMMTVGQSIADPLLIHQLATPKTAPEKVRAMLERVGLTPTEDYYDRYPGDLSGGQQQRVAIARALISHPQLVICDEPVSMLDASIQTQVLELMQSLKDEFNLTYLFITHDLWVARFFCDRIAVMNQGQIVELGPTEQIFMQPQHPYTQTLLGAAPLLARV